MGHAGILKSVALFLLLSLVSFSMVVAVSSDLQPVVITDIHITPDNFVCALNGDETDLNRDLTIEVEAFDDVGVTEVTADFSNINPDLGIVSLTLNEGSGIWSVTVPLTNTSAFNFNAVEIPVAANDAAGNGFVPAEGLTPSAFVVLYSMSTPPSENGECQRWGEATTNFCNVVDFSNVNFVHEIEQESSAICNNGQEMPWGGFKKVLALSFESLDFTDPNIGDKLAQIASAIQAYIVPPGQFGNSYLFVDSSAFQELDTAASITLYGLPFSSIPDVIEPEGRDGQAEITSFVENEPYQVTIEECYDSSGEICDPEVQPDDCTCEFFTQYVPNSDITFTVPGFSQYDLIDNLPPEGAVTLSPAWGHEETVTYVTTSYIDVSLDADGTGTQLSSISLLLDNEEKVYWGWADIFNACTETSSDITSSLQISSDWEKVTCAFERLEGLAEGNHILQVIVTDLGGETGNSVTFELPFTLDSISPTASLDSPLEEEYITGTVTLLATAADEGTGLLTVGFYVSDGMESVLIEELSAAEDGTYSLSWDTSSYSSGWYDLYVIATDKAGNNVESDYIPVFIDNDSPFTAISFENYEGGWVNYDVYAQLTCDDADGSGCAATYYCIDTEDACTPATALGEGEVLTISEGDNYLRYYGIDSLGNEESIQSTSVQVDQSAPRVSYFFASPDKVLLGETVDIALHPIDDGAGLSSRSLPTLRIIENELSLDYSRDKNDIITTTVDVTTDAFSTGVFTIEMVAADSLGNEVTETATFEVVSAAPEEKSYLEPNQNFEEGTTTIISPDELNATLELNVSESLVTSIRMEKSSSNDKSASVSVPELGIYLDIQAPDLEGKIENALIKVSYNDADVASKGIDETTLRLWYYNETADQWEKYDTPNGGVDTVQNFVWANTNHFSVWGLFGSSAGNPDTPSSSGGGGGRVCSRGYIKVNGKCVPETVAAVSPASTPSPTNAESTPRNVAAKEVAAGSAPVIGLVEENTPATLGTKGDNAESNALTGAATAEGAFSGITERITSFSSLGKVVVGSLGILILLGGYWYYHSSKKTKPV